MRVFAGSPTRDAPARSTWFRATTARTIEATAPSSKAVAGTGKLHKEIMAPVSLRNFGFIAAPAQASRRHAP